MIEAPPHAHVWAELGVCSSCGVRRCRRWRCREPHGPGESGLCVGHAHAVEPVRRVPAVRVTTYVWPAAGRAWSAPFTEEGSAMAAKIAKFDVPAQNSPIAPLPPTMTSKAPSSCPARCEGNARRAVGRMIGEQPAEAPAGDERRPAGVVGPAPSCPALPGGDVVVRRPVGRRLRVGRIGGRIGRSAVWGREIDATH